MAGSLTHEALVRPNLDTPFHIDYEWWDRADRDLNVFLRGQLCPGHQKQAMELDRDEIVDFVDREAGEVSQVDRVRYLLASHCALEPEYLTPQTSLVNAVFRVFLANGNEPLSAKDLGQMLERQERMILRTFSGPRIYKGIRPAP